jgi:DNA-binding transcriptional LysR family regulator
MNRQLAFCHIVKTGSFSKAAAALGYTQSAVSQMIRSLENELSLPLLIRSPNGVRLTPEGRELLPYMQTAVNSQRALMEKTEELKGKTEAIIRIGTMSSVSNYWLPKMIKEFQKVYPKTQFFLKQGDYTSISHWAKTGEVDFGFANGDAVKDLIVIPLYTDEMLAVFPVGHPLAQKDAVSLKDLSAEPYIQLDEGSFSEPLNAFSSQNLTPNIKLCVYDDYTVMAMIEEGIGYSIIPEMNLRRHDYNIVKRSLDPKITRSLCLVYRHINAMPKASRLFIDYIRKQFFSPTKKRGKPD